MEKIYATLSSDETSIESAFSVQQLPAVTEITLDDPRWKTFFEQMPEALQIGWPAPVSAD